ncbi:MAG TPA: hypothetical protein VHY58_04235 [Streptosporangiaceae bacterium]|jgi:hypothetical protein|nr:hypothetical protein [Streptosporangiaceae bacterium]
MPGGTERVLWTAVLAVVTLAGLVTLVAGLAGSLSFFGQGVAEAYRRWTSQGLLWGGAAATLAGGAGIAVAWLAGSPGIRRPGVILAAVVGVAAVVTGVVVHTERSRPQGQERSALASLTVPAGAVHQLTTGSIPSGQATEAGPPELGPPVGVRTWHPASCTELSRALAAWADHGSVRVPPGFSPGATGPACLWFASYRGWPVRAELLGTDPAGPGPARVVIAPPGVGL